MSLGGVERISLNRVSFTRPVQREDLLADPSEVRLPQGKVGSDGKETDRWMEAKIGFEHTRVFLCLMPVR